MESPLPEGQSLLPLEHKSPTQRPKQFMVPRRPLPPKSTIAVHEHLSNRKTQDSNATVNVSDHGSQENSQQVQTQHELWSPKWLRRRTLLAFMALFAAFDATLIALWRSNEAENGFRPTLTSNYYAWTYGPTAVLVVVLGLWRQVDYQCKIIQPWQEMRRGAKSAAQSVLLDYISPLNITSFTRAVRYRHMPVAASIAGFATLKLIILFSTGLLVLTPTSVSDTFPVTITTKFNGSSFWDTIPDHGNAHVLQTSQWQLSYLNVSGSPVHTYLGILDGGISDPRGTADGKAFQSFEAATRSNLSSISLQVIAFVPKISCEVAKATPWHQHFDSGVLSMKLDTPTCSVGHEHQTDLSWYEDEILLCDNECNPHEIHYGMWRVNCSETDNSSSYTPLNSDTRYDFRYALAVANLSYPNLVNSTTGNMTAHELSAVICKVDYSADEATLTHEFDTNSYCVNDLTPGSHFKDLTGLMLGEIIHSSFGAVGNLRLPGEKNYYFPENSLFYIMRRTLNGEQAMDRFLSSETLQQSATQVFRGVAVQFMQQFYLVADDADATGDGNYIEERLHIRVVSLWAMVVGFALLVLFSLVIMFATQSDAVPQDPGPIATSAIILVASFSLQKLLHSTGSLRNSQLVERLRGWTFQTNTGDKFNIKIAYEGALTGLVSEARAKHGFWIPYAARYWMVALMFGSALAAIVALQVLYHVSNASMGLVDVSNSEDIALYLSRYISAAVMLLIATSFNSLDFAVTSFAPFSLLRSEALPASRSLYFHLLGEMPPVALSQSLRTLHPGSAFSNMAGIIGSVLTVVASGLWTIDRAVRSNASVTASIASSWDVAWPNSTLNDSGAASILDLIQHRSASFPSNVWNDLVFPDIADVQIDGGRSRIIDPTSQNYYFNVTAIRPVLACDVVEDGAIQWWSGDRMSIRARLPLPPGCQFWGPNGTNYYSNFTMDLGYVGEVSRLIDIHVGPPQLNSDVNPGDYHEYGEGWNRPLLISNQPDNPAGCPSIGIVFAEIRINATFHDDLTVFLCSQKLQQVSVRVAYHGADTHHPSINHDIAPIPDESSAQYLTNGTDGVNTFPYRVESHLGNYLTRVSQRLKKDSQIAQIDDSFFDNLVFGPDGMPFGDLAGRANRDRLLVAINKLYAKYMVLVLDLHLRRPIPPRGLGKAGSEQERFTGTVQWTSARLQVNYASKLALQIMLGVMALLGAGAFWLTDLRGTLPRNPCSIASTMGFLAGSDLCDPEKPILPKGGEWLNRREMEGVLKGWLFSLGWWSHRPGEEGVGGHDGHSQAGLASLHRKEVDFNRFGIDVGTAERLGFRETRWWALRRRLHRKSKDAR
jgi:Protein of unknown function (DUF3433)